LCNCYSSIYVDHMDEKLRKFNVFLSKRYIYVRNSEHIRFVRVFWYMDSPTNFQEYYRYFTHNTQFPTAHSCSNQTIFCFSHSSFFTADFSQPTSHISFFTAHISQQLFKKSQPNLGCVWISSTTTFATARHATSSMSHTCKTCCLVPRLRQPQPSTFIFSPQLRRHICSNPIYSNSVERR
jgi:hypothetical protein